MKKKNMQAYLFLAPFLVMIAVLYLLPALLTIVMAFTSLDSSFIWEFNGLENFQRIFRDPNTMLIVTNTVLFVGISIFFTLVLDLFLAIMTTYFIKSEKIGGIFKAILMIPMITPVVVYSVLWIWLLDASNSGFFNKMYIALTHNGPVNWIAQYPFVIVIIATILVSIAYGTIIFSSAIKSIPENQFKAARIDGAGEWEIVKSIIIPNLRFHISFITLWETLGLLTNYITIMLITNGGPGIQTEVWALSAYHKAFTDRQYGYGAAISLVLIVIVMILMLLIAKMMKKEARG